MKTAEERFNESSIADRFRYEVIGLIEKAEQDSFTAGKLEGVKEAIKLLNSEKAQSNCIACNRFISEVQSSLRQHRDQLNNERKEGGV